MTEANKQEKRYFFNPVNCHKKILKNQVHMTSFSDEHHDGDHESQRDHKIAAAEAHSCI